MAPASDDLSAPGAASYDSNTMTAGDGTWDFSKNTFLLPNLEGLNFDTMKYNGMANRFSTLDQYHRIVLAHGILAAIAFLFLVPISVMTARFYGGRPGYAIKYHAQIHIFAGLLVLVVFILGFFAVGPERSLTNPHHGIGVAIFVLFLLQLVGGRIIRHITKIRSLRVTLHQWFGRAIALLGIIQVPLGLTLYGSPKYLFILYALWMTFLLLVYFILNYRSGSRRELYMSGARTASGRTRITETEYFSDHQSEHHSKWKWLAPLAAGAGIWALFRRRKNKERSRSRSPSDFSRGPEVISSRRGSGSFIDEKYSDIRSRRDNHGGNWWKWVGGAAAAVGAGKLLSNWRDRRDRRHEDEYSAVSTETPRRHRPGRAASFSEYDSELTRDVGPPGTQSSLLPPSAHPPAMAAALGAADARPMTPRASHARHHSGPGYDESDYSSYVSPSRRQVDDRGDGGGGVAKGIMAGLGMGWLAKKWNDRKARREESQRLRDEEDQRSGVSGSRFTGDGYPSPSRRQSFGPPQRRGTGYPPPAASELTESTFDSRPPVATSVPPVPPSHGSGMSPARHSRSQSRHNMQPVSMPTMPPDPRGILHSEAESSFGSLDSRPQRRDSSRRRRAGDRAAAAAAARAGGLAAEEEQSHHGGRERFASPSSGPVSVKLKVHDDRDRNVTLRRLTEEEAAAARGPRGRADSESSLSGIESPSYGRRYRRDSSQRRAEMAAESRAERDELGPLSPPNPAFARGRRQKDSAYYSGQPGPSGSTPTAGQTMSSLGSMASPESHATWSGMSASPSGPGDKPTGSAAADNRRRRRLERRRGSSSRPTTAADMFD